jgi:hypothetical protein
MDGFTDGQLTEELLVEIELLKVSLKRRMEELTEREIRHKSLIAELADALEILEKKETCRQQRFNDLIRKARAETAS